MSASLVKLHRYVKYGPKRKFLLTQVMPTGQDDNHVQYHSLKGARVGVGWMPRVRPVHSKLRHKAREMSGKGRVIFDNCVSM